MLVDHGRNTCGRIYSHTLCWRVNGIRILDDRPTQPFQGRRFLTLFPCFSHEIANKERALVLVMDKDPVFCAYLFFEFMQVCGPDVRLNNIANLRLPGDDISFPKSGTWKRNRLAYATQPQNGEVILLMLDPFARRLFRSVGRCIPVRIKNGKGGQLKMVCEGNSIDEITLALHLD